MWTLLQDLRFAFASFASRRLRNHRHSPLMLGIGPPPPIFRSSMVSCSTPTR